MNLVEQLGAGLTGLEQLKTMLAMGGRAPIGETLDFTFVDAGDGWAAFEGVPGLHAYNPIGTIHGGYIAALLIRLAAVPAIRSSVRPRPIRRWN